MWVSWNSTTVCSPVPALQHPHSLIQLTLMSWVNDNGDLSPKADAGFPGCEVVGVTGLIYFLKISWGILDILGCVLREVLVQG